MNPHRFIVLAPVIVLALGFLSCASTEVARSEVDLRDDLAYAEQLTEEWGSTDLAEELLNRLDVEALGPGDAERVELVRCRIRARRAVAEQDRTRRSKLFEEAITASEGFLEKHPRSEATLEAGIYLVALLSDQVRVLELTMFEVVAWSGRGASSERAWQPEPQPRQQSACFHRGRVSGRPSRGEGPHRSGSESRPGAAPPLPAPVSLRNRPEWLRREGRFRRRAGTARRCGNVASPGKGRCGGLRRFGEVEEEEEEEAWGG